MDDKLKQLAEVATQRRARENEAQAAAALAARSRDQEYGAAHSRWRKAVLPAIGAAVRQVSKALGEGAHGDDILVAESKELDPSSGADLGGRALAACTLSYWQRGRPVGTLRFELKPGDGVRAAVVEMSYGAGAPSEHWPLGEVTEALIRDRLTSLATHYQMVG